jgi:hypothetical protein
MYTIKNGARNPGISLKSLISINPGFPAGDWDHSLAFITVHSTYILILLGSVSRVSRLENFRDKKMYFYNKKTQREQYVH